MRVKRVIPVADGKCLSLPIAKTRQNSVTDEWKKKDYLICNFVTHISIRRSRVLFYFEVPAGTCLKLEKCSDLLEFRYKQVLLYFVSGYVSDKEVRNVECCIARNCVFISLDGSAVLIKWGL
jgi:hypothetical protein